MKADLQAFLPKGGMSRRSKKTGTAGKPYNAGRDYYDYNLLAAVILLTCFGLVMLYSTSAYEAAVAERLSSRIMDGLFDGTVNGDTEKAEFYTELSENTSALIQIRNSIIRKIKDLLLAS